MISGVVIVHEGRGGHVEVGGRRYPIEHVEGGRFCIHFPAGNRASARASDLAALEAVCAAQPDKWYIERRDRA